jgi:hypothetical protein
LNQTFLHDYQSRVGKALCPSTFTVFTSRFDE